MQQIFCEYLYHNDEMKKRKAPLKSSIRFFPMYRKFNAIRVNERAAI